MERCCCQPGRRQNLPLICMVPQDGKGAVKKNAAAAPKPNSSSTSNKFLDIQYIQKHFKLPPRAQYLDPMNTPLISFPMTQDISKSFNMDRKAKINQQILDGILDPSAAIMAPSILPYPKMESSSAKESESDDEVVYILQLPDLETRCPHHGTVIRTPRFVWHTCKKEKQMQGGIKKGPGPMHKPNIEKGILSRLTDFDYKSQWLNLKR